MDQQESVTLDYVKDASTAAQEGLIRYLEHHLGPRFSSSALLYAFEGCVLPMARFVTYAEGDYLPKSLCDDIDIWLFMRMVGRQPKRNILREIDAIEAPIFASALTDPNWRNKVHDPLAIGYLPY